MSSQQQIIVPEHMHALTEAEAAAHLGVSKDSIERLRRKGVLPFYSLHPDARIGIRKEFRIDLKDIMAFKAKGMRTYAGCYIDPFLTEEIPAIFVARIMGISYHSVAIEKWKGNLKDLSPESVREYILKHHNQEYRKRFRVVALAKADGREFSLRQELTRAREKARRTMCVKCGGPVSKMQKRGDRHCITEASNSSGTQASA